MTTDACRRAVFDTAELLENILIHLTMFEIVRCRRVSSQFRDCIKGSTTIAEKLFLKPRQDIEVWTRTREGDQTNFTRSTESASAAMRKLPEALKWFREREPSMSFIVLPELCPLFTDCEYPRFTDCNSSPKRDRTSFRASENTMRIIESMLNNQDVQHEPAKMYLSEAPFNAISVDILWEIGDIMGHSVFDIRRDEPVTLGDVVSTMLQAGYWRGGDWPEDDIPCDGIMQETLESHRATGSKLRIIREGCWMELHAVLVPTAEERRLMKD